MNKTVEDQFLNLTFDHKGQPLVKNYLDPNRLPQVKDHSY